MLCACKCVSVYLSSGELLNRVCRRCKYQFCELLSFHWVCCIKVVRIWRGFMAHLDCFLYPKHHQTAILAEHAYFLASQDKTYLNKYLNGNFHCFTKCMGQCIFNGPLNRRNMFNSRVRRSCITLKIRSFVIPAVVITHWTFLQ